MTSRRMAVSTRLGPTMADITVPSCAVDNRQYSAWQDHFESAWQSQDGDLLEQHRRALQHLTDAQEPRPRALFEECFRSLVQDLDRALEDADATISPPCRTKAEPVTAVYADKEPS